MKTICKTPKFILSCTCVIFALSGCTVGPDYEKPKIDVSKNWSETNINKTKVEDVASKEKSVEWWKEFKDPLLNKLITKAKSQNLTLKEAKARVREARALSHGADAELFPKIDVVGGVTKGDKATAAGGGTTKLFDAGFDAVWEADIFGGNRRSAEAADANFEAVQADYDDVMLSLVAEVARNYVEVRLYQQQLALAKNTAEIQADTARISEARYKQGVEGKLEIVRANAQLSSTKAQIPLYENLIGASTYQLDFLLGEQPGALKKQLAEEKEIPLIAPEIALNEPVKVIANRPDLKVAEHNLAAATALQGVAIADLYPKLSLSAALGFESGSSNNLFRSSNRVWSIGGSVLAPLFDFGRIRANIDAADARQEQAMAQYQAAVLFVLKDVETSLLNYAKETERHEALLDAAANSKKAVEISQLQYKEGVISQLDVLQAQQTMYDADTALAQSTANVSYALIALCKALAVQ